MRNSHHVEKRQNEDQGVSLDIENYCTVSLFFEQAYLWR